MLLNIFLIILGKLVSKISSYLNLGSGSTWPGHIALSLNKYFIRDILRNSETKTILIAGTNGKTTTSKLIQTIFEKNGKKVFRNESGANLLNGITSSILLHSNIRSQIKYDYAIFEVDENTLPLALNEFTPDYILLLNLFRDQLDRYGEVNTIAKKWNSAIQNLPHSTTLILNADDPQIAYLGNNLKNKILYFGINDKKLSQTKYQHATDSIYCPNCGTKLNFDTVYFSHLGEWNCTKCKLKHPKIDKLEVINYPLPGVYNRYNINAAVLFAKNSNISNDLIEKSLKNFSPAFGRQELIEINGKKVQIFLSKNPTSFNESLRTISYLGVKNILFVLNDRIPDGHDVSWIWDVDFEDYLNESIDVSVAGDRAHDMALRLKYSHPHVKHIDTYYPLLNKGVEAALEKVTKNETLYILPTYSAMLEVRKILTGKKIL